MPDLSSFKQSTVSAWFWIFIVLSSIFGVVTSLFAGDGLSFMTNLSMGMGAFWIDKLEKEITRRNAPGGALTPADKVDAVRYRKLRATCYPLTGSFEVLTTEEPPAHLYGDGLDSALDHLPEA